MGSSKFPTEECVEDQTELREAVEETRINDNGVTVKREDLISATTDTKRKQTTKLSIMKRITSRVNIFNTRRKVRRVRVIPIEVRDE